GGAPAWGPQRAWGGRGGGGRRRRGRMLGRLGAARVEIGHPPPPLGQRRGRRADHPPHGHWGHGPVRRSTDWRWRFVLHAAQYAWKTPGGHRGMIPSSPSGLVSGYIIPPFPSVFLFIPRFPILTPNQ